MFINAEILYPCSSYKNIQIGQDLDPGETIQRSEISHIKRLKKSIFIHHRMKTKICNRKKEHTRDMLNHRYLCFLLSTECLENQGANK